MRVLLTCPTIDKSGGVANYYKILRPYLGDEVEYFTVGSRTDHDHPLYVFFRLLKDYSDFIIKLRKGDFDLVHLNPSLAPKAVVRDGIFLLLAKVFGKKVLVFFRGWVPRFERTIRRNWMWLFRAVYFRSDAFIVLASEFKEKLRQMGCRKTIYVETTAVGSQIFQRDNNIDGKKRVDEFNFLFLSRIERNKGIYEMIDAFGLVKMKYPEVTLKVVGDGRELERAKKYTLEKETRDTVFLGNVDGEDKEAAFLRADAYVFPTRYGEGMPNSLLEAMAYGLPVITRPVGGIKDFFEDGKMGFITESIEPSALAELMAKLVCDDDLCRSMGAYNRHYAQDHFRDREVADRIKLIHREVANLHE